MKRSKNIMLFLAIVLIYAVPASASVNSLYKKYRNDNNISRYRYVDIDQNGVKEMAFGRTTAGSVICGVYAYMFFCLFLHQLV